MTFSKWLAPAIASTLLFSSCGKKDDADKEQNTTEEVSTTVDDLFMAAISNDSEKLSAIIKKGADIEAIDGTGRTALHLAAESGASDTLKTLIQHGASVDTLTNDGETALFLATKENKVDAIRVLLRQNASPDLKNSEGFRPLTAAAHAGNKEAVEALALYSRNYLDDALFLASLKGYAPMIDTLTNYGASVYSRLDKDGRTPLMLAAQNGHQEAVRVLLENGANRYSTDNEGNTASELASETGHQEIAEYLGEAPTKEDFSISGQDTDLIQEAVLEVVDLEKQNAEALLLPLPNQVEASPDTLSPELSQVSEVSQADLVHQEGVAQNHLSDEASTAETPLAKTNLKVIALNGRELKTSPEKPITDTLTFKTYREETLPIKVTAVDSKKVRIKYLYGEHKTVDVHAGEMIPKTSLKVVSAKQKRDHSKMTASGEPADVSVVMVEDSHTGQRRNMTTGLNVGRTEPFAVIKEYSSGSLLVAKRGDVFRKSDGVEYEVLEVRSTQLILMNSTTGEVHTVKK